MSAPTTRPTAVTYRELADLLAPETVIARHDSPLVRAAHALRCAAEDAERAQEMRETLEKSERALADARMVPTWAVLSETDSSTHHHSERRADSYAAKVNEWIGNADAALSAARTVLGGTNHE